MSMIHYNKWKRYGFPLKLFYSHPEFSHFVLSSPLGSQMKVTGDTFSQIDGDPAILVEGEWTAFAQIAKRFSVQYSPRYRQKFLVEKSSGKVFTYVGGQGLIEHHPYKAAVALKKISQEEYTKSRELAQSFDGRDEEAILQIVTTQSPGKSPYFSARHLYLRLIDRDRNCYSIGFGYDDPIRVPLKSGRGLVRSPDFWEYKRAKARAITNIPISKSGVSRLLNFVKKCQSSESYAFHILHHNCATFTQAAVKYATGLNIPTRVRLKDLFRKFLPRWICLPLKFLFGTVGTAFIALGSLLLGEGSGHKFGTFKKNKKFVSPATRIDYWVDFSALSWNDPLVTMRWQMRQKSTILQAQ
ncbi:MAG: hypothetical protein ChlgKO_09220 [Chlamydiales bacterium]